MDPAFSLEEELTEYAQHHSQEHRDPFHEGAFEHYDLQTQQHGALDSLDDELEGLQLSHRGNGVGDLASELGGLDGGAGGSLADELDLGKAGGHYTDEMGSLADELGGIESGIDHIGSTQSWQEEMSRTASNASYHSSAYDTGLESSPGTSSPSRPGTLSRASNLSSPTRHSSSSFLAANTAAQTAEIQESIRSTDLFLKQLASTSARGKAEIGAVPGTVEMEGADDTAMLESMASTFLKLLYDCSNQREAQIRELRDLDRQSSRLLAESPAVFALSSSSSIETDLVSSASSSFDTFPSSSSSAFTAGTELSEVAEEGDVDGDESRDSSYLHSSTSPTRALRTLHKSHKSSASLASDTTITGGGIASLRQPPLDTTAFRSLHASTLALVSSLTSLHEHSQVTKSSISDAARRLKALKTVIGQWKTEQESVERSEEWIHQNGTKSVLPAPSLATSVNGVGDSRSVKAWTQDQIEFCKRKLEDAEAKAQILLTPVSIAG